MFYKSLSFLALAAKAFAQTSSSYVDPTTNISFQSIAQADISTRFSFALPSDGGSDFIGQIVGPSTGWAGMSLAGNMADSLLVVAYVSGTSVLGSLRETSSYAAPAVYTDGNGTIVPIPTGISVNDTAFTYTFLCRSCLDGTLTFSADTQTPVVGWAVSTDALADSSSADATLGYHGAGFGQFGLQAASAKSSDFSTWRALASTDGNGTTNTTTPDTPSTTTAPPAAAATTTTVANATYDYIVAGGGPAGIIAASRLSESGASVLLLERGPGADINTDSTNTLPWNKTLTPFDVPALGSQLTAMSATSSAYCTDTASMAGCLLGGSGSINALMFVRPQPADFENWPTGWNWDDVKDAAARLYELNPGTDLPSADGKRYDQGVYNVMSPVLAGAGWSEVDAIKNPELKVKAYTHPPWNIKNGERAGPLKTYLPDALARSNFKLQLGSKVVRVVRSNDTATGVEVEVEVEVEAGSDAKSSRQIINLSPNGRVILAAGALSTPRILINSGIGPTAQIQTVANSSSTSIRLPPQSDWLNLPVGEGVKDHPIFTLTFNLTSSNTNTNTNNNNNNTNKTLSAYDFTPLIAGTPAQSDIDTFASDRGVLTQAGQRLTFWSKIADTSDGVARYVQGTCSAASDTQVKIKVYLTHGLTSSGTLAVTSTGATTFTTKPWLTDEADTAAAASFIDELISYTTTTTTNNSTTTLLTYAGEKKTGAEIITDYTTGAHFVHTAAMGKVVDSDTQVMGVEGLHVVDASMHPDLPTGNTQAIVMVAAEKAVERILALGGAGGAGAGEVVKGNSTTVTTASTATSETALPVDEPSSSVPAGLTPPAGSVPTGTAVSQPASGIGTVPAVSSPAAPASSSAAAPAVSSSGAVPAPSQTSKPGHGQHGSGGNGGKTVSKYGQCGGNQWTGSTKCEKGCSCVKKGEWYSQCL